MMRDCEEIKTNISWHKKGEGGAMKKRTHSRRSERR
jgi:hypothetical protein